MSLSDFLTLFSSRCLGWFWESMPSAILMTAATFSLGLSTLLACVWPEGETDHTPTEGLALGEYRLWPLWIWIYCIIWWFLQDIAKARCAARCARLAPTLRTFVSASARPSRARLPSSSSPSRAHPSPPLPRPL